MNNKYYLATVLLALGAFSPLYGVHNGGGGGALLKARMNTGFKKVLDGNGDVYEEA